MGTPHLLSIIKYYVDEFYASIFVEERPSRPNEATTPETSE